MSSETETEIASATKTGKRKKRSPEKDTARERAIRSIRENGRPPRGHLKRTAASYGISGRQFGEWIRIARSGEPLKKRGRPKTSEHITAATRIEVRAVLETMGWTTGEPRIMAVLGKARPRRVVRRVLQEEKRAHRARMAAAEKAKRLTIVPLAKNVIWAQDATMLARDEQTAAVVTTEVVRDAATTDVGGVSPIIGCSEAKTAIEAFGDMAVQRGVAPLVDMTDNGSAYQSEYDEMLASKKVVHLRNLPHTPKHNAVAERAVRELKEEAHRVLMDARLERTNVKCRTLLEEWQIGTQVAIRRIRIRPRSGLRLGKCCEELDKSLPEAEDLVDRDVFYAAATEAMAAARQAHEKPRAKRIAERRALLLVLLKFGLVRVLVGGVPVTAENAEVFW